jgi:trimethylamine:corrinoid methyltransferase-like protein
METRAAKQIDTILEKHQVEPLPDEVQKAIRGIVEREQAWINAKG